MIQTNVYIYNYIDDQVNVKKDRVNMTRNIEICP